VFFGFPVVQTALKKCATACRHHLFAAAFQRGGSIQAERNETPALIAGISREYLLHHQVCPKRIDDTGALTIAAAPGALREAIGELAAAYKRPAVVDDVSAVELEGLIERLTTESERPIELAVGGSESDDLTADVRELANQPPVVRYVNLLVRDAYDAGASDIHLEAERGGMAARFRLDGVLSKAPAPPTNLQHAVISRVKLLAELDIAERRKPQDGRIRVRLESRELDVRVSTVPTVFGESVVLRLLDRGGRPVILRDLGMPPDVFDGVSLLASRPHGLVLVTGPTGSGKTTTLYAALQSRDSLAEKIVTVEDPVEYQLPGVTQVPVHRQAGVTFSSALRSILRQDPDVVMIGEMRDTETAEIAVQAAMTGHLVFSTLHTNDAVGAIPRLLDLGVPEYLVAATVEGVLAQRLVRTICKECRGTGCKVCRGTGFKGRVGVFELVQINDVLRDAITRRDSRDCLRRLATEAGMRPMAQDADAKVRAGLTTPDEVRRVLAA
jgi:general secretion pathway protein E